MIDGIKLSYPLKDAKAWTQATSIDFAFYIEEKSGEKLAKKKSLDASYTTYIKKAVFETYSLLCRETHRQNSFKHRVISNWLNVEGSLHKNYFKGNNHQPFTWQALQSEITYLKTSLQLEQEAKIDNLEVGINVPMPFPVFTFLQKNLISYKGNSFKEYAKDEKGIVLGYHCPLTQYEVKVYDKGLQFNLPYPLLRFELRYKKMEILNRLGIFNLTDLQSREKVYSCLALLLQAWDDILLFDYAIDVNTPSLSAFQRDLLLKGTDRTHWEILKKSNERRFKDHRQKFRSLIQQYGNNYHLQIRQQIESEWLNLMNSKSTLLKSSMSEMTFKIKCQNVHSKTCLTCGRDISDQHISSKYCSEERLGKEGKKCRNKASNPINNLKRKIASINKKGVLFDINPYLKKKHA